VLVSHSRDRTALAALDQVIDKMERQLVKFKEKLSRKNNHSTPRRAKVGPADGAADNWW
jgi:ribosome-associated translation inhibitor RaiA